MMLNACLAENRVVIFGLRAKQAKTPSQDFSHGLTQYWQMSFAIGYLTIFTDLCLIMRALFVKTTQGTASQFDTSLLSEESSDVVNNGYGSIDDQPERRQQFRKLFGILKLLGLIPIITGAIAGLLYVPGESNESKGDLVQVLRFVHLKLFTS